MKLVLSVIMLLLFACDGTDNSETVYSNSWVFVANEGNMGDTPGSVSMISEDGDVVSTDYIGKVVNSVEVYNDKLVALINGGYMPNPEDSKIIIYNITTAGLSMPGIEINLDGSEPREMVIVDNLVYFTNWGTSDVKVFNLYTYDFEASIPVGSDPEGIIVDGAYLWVANSGDGTVSKIDISSHSVIDTYSVGDGPQRLIMNEGTLYVSRTHYDASWNTYHGASKIENGDIMLKSYGAGAPCGGTILSHNLDVFRSYDGGLARMDSDLNLEEVSIGLFDQSQVYHIEKINENFWFAITNYVDVNEVHVLSSDGIELDVYNVGRNPGDFAFWSYSD